MSEKRPDENDRLKAGELTPNAFDGTRRVALRAVTDGEKRRNVEPQDGPAEIALVASLLWSGANQPNLLRAGAVIDLLPDGQAFYNRDLADVYEASLWCFNEKQEHDPVAVSSRLVATGKSRPATSYETLVRLMANASTVSERQVRVYAESIRRTWGKRVAINDLRQVIEDARDPKVESEAIYERARSAAQAMQERMAGVGAVVSLKQSCEILFRELQKGQNTAMRTGLTDVDELLNGGVRPGESSIIAARTSVGKSAIATQIEEAMVTLDPSLAALHVSMEMAHQQHTARLVAARAGVTMAAIRRVSLNKEQWERITTAVGEIAGKSVYFTVSMTQTLVSIFAAARALQIALAREGRRLALLIIENINHVKPSAEILKRGSRQQQVGETSRGMKFIAVELGLHVMGLAQIHRDSERQSGEKIPKLHHLRESGDLEQDADQIMILHRPRDPETNEFLPDMPAAFLLAKGRLDATGATLLEWDSRAVRFRNWTDPSRTFRSFYGKDAES